MNRFVSLATAPTSRAEVPWQRQSSSSRFQFQQIRFLQDVVCVDRPAKHSAHHFVQSIGGDSGTRLLDRKVDCAQHPSGWKSRAALPHSW